jgi:hypothetical protein
LAKHPNERLRLYIIEHVYERFKEKLIQSEADLEKLDGKIQEFAAHFLEIAKK